MSTAAEKRHLDRLSRLGCMLCRFVGGCKGFGPEPGPVEIHHPKEWTGAAQRASDWLAIPLCTDCHRGPNGLHGLGKKGFYMRYKIAEHDLLAMTIQALSA
jgi:hypothetical protein